MQQCHHVQCRQLQRMLQVRRVSSRNLGQPMRFWRQSLFRLQVVPILFRQEMLFRPLLAVVRRYRRSDPRTNLLQMGRRLRRGIQTRPIRGIQHWLGFPHHRHRLEFLYGRLQRVHVSRPRFGFNDRNPLCRKGPRHGLSRHRMRHHGGHLSIRNRKRLGHDLHVLCQWHGDLETQILLNRSSAVTKRGVQT